MISFWVELLNASPPLYFHHDHKTYQFLIISTEQQEHHLETDWPFSCVVPDR
ncbi:hypothetical protein J2751_002580 [Halorubrum alkaliphilum]|uniref:Uncharacterized protein n=1 Tax=Halorubrum alkaliphilum TaxID=261290 RepID=A0A8T4GGA4_9EURY|nr:hypothetical protein [Halorubrum alkaliphilum]